MFHIVAQSLTCQTSLRLLRAHGQYHTRDTTGLVLTMIIGQTRSLSSRWLQSQNITRRHPRLS